MRFPHGSMLAVMMAVLSWTVTAQAATPEELFREGAAASERGDYEAAARAFDEAYALEPFPISKYNAAENWYEVPGGKEAARAADAYRVALEADARAGEDRLELAPEIRTRATQRLAELGQRLCLVTASEPIGGALSIERMVGVPIHCFILVYNYPNQIEVSLQQSPVLPMHPVLTFPPPPGPMDTFRNILLEARRAGGPPSFTVNGEQPLAAVDVAPWDECPTRAGRPRP